MWIASLNHTINQSTCLRITYRLYCFTIGWRKLFHVRTKRLSHYQNTLCTSLSKSSLSSTKHVGFNSIIGIMYMMQAYSQSAYSGTCTARLSMSLFAEQLKLMSDCLAQISLDCRMHHLKHTHTVNTYTLKDLQYQQDSRALVEHSSNHSSLAF